MTAEILLGAAAGQPILQPAATANRHGLIAGATGTGKTITLQILAEGFSRLGVPCFAADVKGDLSGLARAATPNPRIADRVQRIGIADYTPRAQPVALWDVFGKQGVPVRIAVSEMGPLLFARLLNLNETQTGVLYACFRVADDNGLLLLDLKDLRAMLVWLGEHARELTLEYGNITAASVGAIQRKLLTLEEQGAASIFGEPALAIADLLVVDANGRGVINLLDATELLARAPDLYACFLFWLLSEVYETLPEAGDLAQPKFVLFFDEAHLLFNGAPTALLEKIEQVVRLIRSKGVGVFFVTQSPGDVPASVLGQLGLKIQHALRAFTPQDRKSVKLVAESFRANPGVDVATLVTELATGEALVSVLDVEGRPTPVAHTLIRPPESSIGALATHERRGLVMGSAFYDKYANAIDRDSAYEALKRRTQAQPASDAGGIESSAPSKTDTSRPPTSAPAPQQAPAAGSSRRQSAGEAMLKSTVRAIGSQLGQQIVRGILGSLLGGSRRR